MMATRKKNAASKAQADAAAPKAAPKAVTKTATKRSKPMRNGPDALDTVTASDAAILRAEGATEATVDVLTAPATRLVAAGTDQAREAYAQAQAISDQIRQKVAATATVTTRGAIDINAKMLAAWQAQSEIALDLWRQTLAAGSVSDAVRLQASGARQAYETAATHWKDVAETTTRWFSAAVKPFQSDHADQGR